MRRTRLVALATASLMSAAGTLSLTATQAGAQPGVDPQTSAAHGKGNPSDSLSTKWQRKYQKRNEAAIEKRVRQGGSGESVRLGRHKYGRVAQTGTDKIFVVLARVRGHPALGVRGQAKDAQRVNGPMHNEIPAPDRKTDNSTLWQKDYNQSPLRRTCTSTA